jgi:hypothetical protein
VKILLLVVAALLVGAVVAGYVWARTYAPLSGECCTFGPGEQNLGASVDPVSGSGGKPVFFPKIPDGRVFTTAFDLSNTGRFAVRIRGLVGPAPDDPLPNIRIRAVALELPRKDVRCCLWGPRYDEPFHPFTLRPRAHQLVVIRWRPYCSRELRAQKDGSTDTSRDWVELRYRYLDLFERTQVVALPFAVTVQCGGTLPPSTAIP